MDQAYLEFTWAQFVFLSKKLISYIFIRPLRSNKLNYLSNSNSNGQKSYLSGSKQ